MITSRTISYTELECQGCHNRFKTRSSYVTASLKKGSKVKYCSKECKYKHIGDNTPLIDRTCRSCGKTFKFSLAMYNRLTRQGISCGKYCTQECRLNKISL